MVTNPRTGNSEVAMIATDRTDESRGVLLYADPDTHSLLYSIVDNTQNASTTIYATNLVVKTSSGRLKGFTGYNSKTAAQFIQVHDAPALPANGAIPKIIFTVPTVANFSMDFGVIGRYFTTGIVVCNSSTGPTLTIGSADIWVDAQYV